MKPIHDLHGRRRAAPEAIRVEGTPIPTDDGHRGMLGQPGRQTFGRALRQEVEHLMVLGTISETSKEHRAVITPSTGALLLAFQRSGPDVRRALAHGWGIEDILLRRDDDGDRVDYDGLRLALACRWLRRPLPRIESIAEDFLEDLLSHVAPRVKEAPPADDAAPEKLSA